MTPSAAEILARTVQAYARCTSYRDTGEAVTELTHLGDPAHDLTLRKPFSTLFVRPSSIRHEFSYSDGADKTARRPRYVGADKAARRIRYVVWGDAQESHSWWSTRPGVRTCTSLTESLAGAGGLSDMASWRVPSLLLAYAELVERPAEETAALRMDAEPDGSACHVVAGTARGGGEVELWIDAATSLLRRVRTRRMHDQASRDATLEQRASDPKLTAAESYRLRVLTSMGGGTYWRTITTTYAAEIDTPIASEELAFAPPA